MMKMKMKQRGALLISLIFGSFVFLTGCGGNQQPSSGANTTSGSNPGATPKMTLTIAHTGAEDSMNQYVSLRLKEKIEAKSNKNITVQVYPSGQLGSDKDLIRSSLAGDVTFHVCSTGPLVNDVPGAGVIDIPFLLKDVKMARQVVNDPEFKSLFEKEFEKAGFKLMMTTDQGFRQLSTNKKITKIDDLKGMKIRTMENKNHINFWGDLGVNATPLNFAEVYVSLQQGLLDGQENPYNIIYGSKFYEVQKYVTNSNHIFHLMTVTMSQNVFNKLPDAYKTIITESMSEVADMAAAESDRSTSEYLQKIIKSGVEYIDFDKIPGMRDELIKRTSKSIDRVKTTVNPQLVDAFLKAVEKASENRI